MKNRLQIFSILILLIFFCFGCEVLHQAQTTRQKRKIKTLIDQVSNIQQQSNTKPSDYDSQEKEVHQLVNQYRQQVGLSPLLLRLEISEVAREHSQNMANKTVTFGHDGFQKRTNDIKNKIIFKKAAENVAMNNNMPRPSQTAVQGWIRSEGHKQNMEGDYNLTGVGIIRSVDGSFYFTQIFISTY